VINVNEVVVGDGLASEIASRMVKRDRAAPARLMNDGGVVTESPAGHLPRNRPNAVVRSSRPRLCGLLITAAPALLTVGQLRRRRPW
jgi:hypothetical protein